MHIGVVIAIFLGSAAVYTGLWWVSTTCTGIAIANFLAGGVLVYLGVWWIRQVDN